MKVLAIVSQPKPNVWNFHDLEGRRFGRLTVIAYAGSDGKTAKWWCRCDCGTITCPAAGKLRTGRTKSCGCFKDENTGNRARSHGKRSHPLYNTWAKLRRRCLVQRDVAFSKYGGRGITVCDRWLNGDGTLTGLECFLADMGPKPGPEYSIDRIDNDGNYEPSNCRWATAKEQARNRRSNYTVEVGGETMSLSEACDRLNVSYATVNDRIQKGWGFWEAVKRPLREW